MREASDLHQLVKNKILILQGLRTQKQLRPVGSQNVNTSVSRLWLVQILGLLLVAKGIQSEQAPSPGFKWAERVTVCVRERERVIQTETVY